MRRLFSADPLAGGFLLLGGFFLYQALQLSMRSLDGGPGPGLLPASLAGLMVLFAVRSLLLGAVDRIAFGNLRRVAAMVAAVALYAAGLDRLGFVLTSSIAMVALMVVFNERLRIPLAALGIVGSAAAFWLFYVALRVQLPPDPWGMWR